MKWHPIADMSMKWRDGRPVWLRAGGKEFMASREVGFINDDHGDVAAWCEKIEGEAPHNWTDGVCWSSNADGHPSSKPTHYKETTP